MCAVFSKYKGATWMNFNIFGFILSNWTLQTVNYHYCCLLQVTELTPCETENPMGGWSLKLKFCFPQRFISSVFKRLRVMLEHHCEKHFSALNIINNNNNHHHHHYRGFNKSWLPAVYRNLSCFLLLPIQFIFLIFPEINW